MKHPFIGCERSCVRVSLREEGRGALLKSRLTDLALEAASSMFAPCKAVLGAPDRSGQDQYPDYNSDSDSARVCLLCASVTLPASSQTRITASCDRDLSCSRSLGRLTHFQIDGASATKATANVAIPPERVDYPSAVEPLQRHEKLIKVSAHGLKQWGEVLLSAILQRANVLFPLLHEVQ